MGSRGFWRELKRRHVYRVAAAYAVVGWLLIQVATQVFPVFHLPDWIEQAVVLVILVGFPIALVLAWAFDATPHGIVATDAAADGGAASVTSRRRSRRTGMAVGLMGVLIAATAGGAWWQLRAPGARPVSASFASRSLDEAQRNPGNAVPDSVAKAASSGLHSVVAALPIPTKSIAVLPFENLSADKGNAYFADGMQDLILTKLADIGDLKVISRTSTEKYKSHPDDLKTVGQQLGVATILEGSVQKAGNQVLINVQLIDAKTDNHLWAESYTRTLDNIFGVEGEVAEKIAAALNAKLTTSEKVAVAKAPTHNKQALDDYLRGTYYVNHNVSTEDPVELKHAVALLEQATLLDPGFTDAFSALSLAYQHLGGHDKQAETAATQALALNPGDANAHRMVAYILMEQGKFDEALLQAKEAVRLAPQSALINNGLGNVYRTAGQVDKAAAWYRRALELDPKQNIIRINLGFTLAALRRYADANETLRMATMTDPSSIRAATSLAWVQELGNGDLAGARETLQAVMTPASSSGALSDALYWVDFYSRDYPAALAVIRQAPASWFQEQDYPLALYEGQVYRAQGNESKAKRAFTLARATLEAKGKQAPEDANLLANLSLAIGGLGDAQAAATQAQRAVRFAGDYYSRDECLLNLAAVEAWTGQTKAAVKLLDELLGKPAGDLISANSLKFDPTWDSIRHDPRFQALLKKYAQPGPASANSAGTSAATVTGTGNG